MMEREGKPPDDDTRLKCIWAAVERCEEAERFWRETETDPSSSGLDRLLAKKAFQRAEDEFGWQWRNVRALFEPRPRSATAIELLRRHFPLRFFQRQLTDR